MRRLAYLCPGQGAQVVGMGRDLCEEFPIARRTFEEAETALGLALSRICWEGPDEVLMLTENAQPALLTVSVAVGRILESEGDLAPTIAAGHSLGEWSAWVIVGALDFAEAVRAVRRRGELMQRAVSPGEGAMSAILGVERNEVEEMCRHASRGEEIVVAANLNGGGQIVVAGHVAAVSRLEALAVAAGRRVSRLKVSAPFHSPLMAPAAEAMEPVLAAMTVSNPRAPVVTNVEGRPETDPRRIRALLQAQITAPVRWEECARAVTQVADAALEVGPGRVLRGLMRRIDRSFVCHSTHDVEGIRRVLEDCAR